MMQSEEKKTPKEGRKNSRGVPFGVVTMLVILALVSGGALGYLGGVNLSGTAQKLKEARRTIDNYEITLMEMYSDEFDRAAAAAAEEGANAALAGTDMGVASEEEPVVVAEFDGGVVMSDEATSAYQREVANYVLGGADVTGSTEEILDTVLQNLVGEKLAYIEAEKKGYMNLTDADRAAIAERAQAQFDETVNFYIDIVREEGMSEEDAYAAAVSYLAANEGYTLDAVTADIEANWWHDKLYEEVVAGATVSADVITTAYNDRLAAQEALFTSDKTEFEYALMNGEMVLYYPEGYRAVKHIFFALDEDAQARAAEIYAQRAKEEDQAAIDALNAELDALYADAEAEAQAAYEQILGGADFDVLMDERSDDAEFAHGAFKDTGYYVSADSVMWSKMFIETCMALENPGDISAPARSEGGVHIVRYLANVQPGAVPLSQVNAEITEATIESARFEAWQVAQQGWIAAANATFYPERMTGLE